MLMLELLVRYGKVAFYAALALIPVVGYFFGRSTAKTEAARADAERRAREASARADFEKEIREGAENAESNRPVTGADLAERLRSGKF